ncbi:MAG: hypothetical protein JSW15_11945 [Deltaproteobacteria bacterium]|nr:MAG: hypothetical protein JSW15_11945 [Deltaproteobacteria bacterium]
MKDITHTKCALCHNTAQLRESDIIPRFAHRWIKNTSSTGRLRDIITPKLPKQKVPTVPLLCDNCEEQFSRYEKHFSENFFKPYLESYHPSFQYDETLQKFIISLAWRTVAQPRTLTNLFQKHHQAAYEAETHWRNILNHEKLDDIYEHHMLFLRLVKYPSHRKAEFEGINWYFLRSVDNTIAQNQNEVFAFTLIPGFAFISPIKPKTFTYSKNTNIHRPGTIDIRDQDFDTPLFNFFKSRAAPIQAAIASLSEAQWHKIEEYYRKNMNSYGFAVFQADKSGVWGGSS